MEDIYHMQKLGWDNKLTPICLVLYKITKHNNASGSTSSKWQLMQLPEPDKSKERFYDHIQLGTGINILHTARKSQKLSQTPFMGLILTMFSCPDLKYLV